MWRSLRRCGRAADDEPGRQGLGTARLFAAQLRDEHAAGNEALLYVGLVDGGEGRFGARGFGHVVEAHHREVSGYGEPHPLRGLEDAEGELVAQGQDRRGTRLPREQHLGRNPTLLRRVLRDLVDGHVPPVEARGLDGGGVAFEPELAGTVGRPPPPLEARQPAARVPAELEGDHAEPLVPEP